jgi:hypothetical protein
LAALIITWVLAPFNARPLSLVYLTMASASRCSSLCASSMSLAYNPDSPVIGIAAAAVGLPDL